jgi:predicted RNase H-like nuclease (RuvC/YqgF family)
MRSLVILLACISFLLSAGVAESQSGKGSTSHAAQKSSTESRSTAAQAEDLQSLRENITRMKALVQQMETNLSFVDTTQSPLKHQFQLEIDMWRTLITDMERRLAQSRQSAP